MPQPAYHLQHVVGQGGHVSFAVHLPQTAEPGLGPAAPVQRCEGPFCNGLAAATYKRERRRQVPLPSLQVDRVIHRQAEIPSFLSRRQTGILDRAGLAILLTRYVFKGAASPMESTTTQDHAHYSIDTKSYGIRGRWNCLHRRLSRAEPLEKSGTIDVAYANFWRSKSRDH